MVKIHIQFQTKTAHKNYTLCCHTYLSSLYGGVPTTPRDSSVFRNAMETHPLQKMCFFLPQLSELEHFSWVENRVLLSWHKMGMKIRSDLEGMLVLLTNPPSLSMLPSPPLELTNPLSSHAPPPQKKNEYVQSNDKIIKNTSLFTKVFTCTYIQLHPLGSLIYTKTLFTVDMIYILKTN